ncbi:MAG: dTMP kinase [Actinomycetota bacterium]|nr:dTMP kinase [Actinomycetota bacterium]
MGRLVAIEGLDGAGKRTLAEVLAAQLRACGASVAGLAFPRYGCDVHAELARDALYGRMGDLVASVYGMATLFALDRRAAADDLRMLVGQHDVVLCDRYVASNAAYGAARLHQDAAGEFVTWVRALEIERFGVPVPDLQLLLQVPVQVAVARAGERAGTVTDRAKDTFESDDALQTRCAAVYDELAAGGWLAPWHVFDGAGARGGGPEGAALAALLLTQEQGPVRAPE